MVPLFCPAAMVPHGSAFLSSLKLQKVLRSLTGWAAVADVWLSGSPTRRYFHGGIDRPGPSGPACGLRQKLSYVMALAAMAFVTHVPDRESRHPQPSDLFEYTSVFDGEDLGICTAQVWDDSLRFTRLDPEPENAGGRLPGDLSGPRGYGSAWFRFFVQRLWFRMVPLFCPV